MSTDVNLERGDYTTYKCAGDGVVYHGQGYVLETTNPGGSFSTEGRNQELLLPLVSVGNPSLCQCDADGEQYILHDSGDVIYIASMMLWNEVFSALQPLWWFRTQIEPLGGVAVTEADHCNFLTDFELPAINSIRVIMDVNYHGCLFHYTQCIVRNRDSHQLRRECSKTAAVAVLQKATSTASACDAVPRYF
ncbi:unnamed protein product [Heligmosomoides polygyrus]|uniref:Ig-like domain-containing protein n=1 Tax=Heligmosomoides polygyrus TaxID=6339 RepID=A0A3P7ZBL1_HELPZ|nr:unnamed protein product [Heligmosomoides polygyrus]